MGQIEGPDKYGGVRMTSLASVRQVARDLGVHHEARRLSVRQAEADSGRRRALLTSDEREELRRLRKENAELKRANAILKDGLGRSSSGATS